MAFTHTNSPWGEWLRQVQAGRSPNVKVTGQEVTDELVSTVQVANVGHLADPVDWIVGGCYEQVTATPGVYGRLEVVANRSMWIVVSVIDGTTLAYCWTQALPDLGGHALPPSVFSGTPVNTYDIGATALGEPDSECWIIHRNNYTHSQYPQWPIFVPRGRVFVCQEQSVNTTISFSAQWREIPNTR